MFQVGIDLLLVQAWLGPWKLLDLWEMGMAEHAALIGLICQLLRYLSV